MHVSCHHDQSIWEIRAEGGELVLAELGRGDDQGAAGRGEKPARTLRIEANPAPSEACSPRRTVFQ